MESAGNSPDSAGTLSSVRVGLLGYETATNELRRGLERQGLTVERMPPLPAGLQAVRGCRAQVLLVDMTDAGDTAFDAVDSLVEQASVPVLFNETDPEEQTGTWLRRLAGKLRQLARSREGPRSDEPRRDASPVAAGEPDRGDDFMVWVLGASFGGPEAVRRFFAALPGTPPAAFFLAQHIGDGFVGLLATQLNRTTDLQVQPARTGLRVEAGNVYVAPVDEVIRFDAAGRLRLERDRVERTCRPSVDLLMQEVAARYGARSGAIVFSGMGDDGVSGVRAIAAAGGEIWAQDSGSSAVSSMPDRAAATGAVSRRGPPEELAAGLAAYLDSCRVQR